MIPFLPGRRVGHIVNPETGCWDWTGACGTEGYGRVGLGQRVALAHLAYWERANGPKPSGFDLDHLCRNKKCVNPAHLEVVTRFINSIRGRKAKLKPDQVRAIRRKYAEGNITGHDLAGEFGIPRSTIYGIVYRQRWAQLDETSSYTG